MTTHPGPATRRRLGAVRRIAVAAALIGTLLVAPDVLAETPRDGVYLMTRRWTSGLETDVFLFDRGRVARQPAGNPDAFDFAAAAAQAPDRVGRITIGGGRMVADWSDGSRTESDLETSTDRCFYWDAGLFCPVSGFRPGDRIAGVFSGGARAGGVANATTLTLTAAGGYTWSSTGSISTDVVSALSLGGESGSYELAGTVLTLRPTGGPARAVLSFPYDTGRGGPQPNALYVRDGFMMREASAAAAQPPTAGPGMGAGPGAAPASAPASGRTACPSDFRGAPDRLACVCSADATNRGTVWGSGPYTDDSAICRAALHNGALGPAGGSVTAERRPGQAAYVGTTANGVSSNSYGAWGTSFAIVGGASPGKVKAAGTGSAAVAPCPGNFRESADGLVCLCPPDALAGAAAVWGTDTYTDDSSICRAARHAGAVAAAGGPVRLEAQPGVSAYAGTARNGIETLPYGAWNRSFRVLPQ